jgi:hypothetical protein
MVKINGKKFKIYDLDNLLTIKDRIAFNLKTLPEYLYFPNGLTYDELSKKNIIVKDFLSEIKDDAKNNSSVFNLIDSSKKDFGDKFNVKDKIVGVWLSYNETLQKDVANKGEVVLDSIINELVKRKIYLAHSQFKRDWKNILQTKLYIEKSIKSQSKKIERAVKLFDEFNFESAVSTPFRIEYIQFILTLEMNNISMLELFNSVVLTPLVPFVTTHNFYKIKTDYIPSTEWAVTTSDSMILKVYQKDYIINNSNTSNYSDTIIKLDPVSNNFSAEISIDNSKGNVSNDVFTQRSLEIFPDIDISIGKTEESKIIGVFYYPNLTLDKYVFSDLVMNDDIFKLVISIDDHEKATKKKAGLYIHFEHQNTGSISATITEKRMVKGDISMKDEDLDFFPIGEPYIRVRISNCNNSKSVEIFKEILGKLFILYDQKYNEIRDFYREYIPDFGDIEEEEKIEEEVKLNDKAPDLFVSNYTRNCKPTRMPTIVDEEEAIELMNEGKQVIKFPRDAPADPNAVRFPLDGVRQNYYTCKHKVHKHVGLKLNKLKNASTYPYVPCCFKPNQMKNPKYLHYYEGKTLDDAGEKKQNIIKTNKILKHDQYGNIPSDIENLFTITDPNPNFEYVRRGTGIGSKRNVNSFLNAVMEAFNYETNILSITDEDELEAYLIDQRHLFATKENVALCRQELYDLTSNQIIDLLQSDTYLDPRLFIRLLEDKFKCNIFLFTKNFLNGEMILPRHTQAYYRNRNENRCVYVYEHMGSESDDSIKYPFPQCELIIKYNIKSSKVQEFFSYKESENIRDVYLNLQKSYALNKPIVEINLPITTNIKIKSQWIDSYGKTRRLIIVFDSNKISIITTPLQPLKVKEIRNTKIYKTDVDTAIKLATLLKIKIQSQTLIGDVVKEITGVWGNITISIPIENDDKVIDGIVTKEDELSFNTDKDSLLEKYNKNKKFARYLVEYTMWFFSKYLNSSGKDISDKNVAEFAQKYFQVDPDFIYKNKISKTFTENNSFTRNGKIIVHTEETIKRLVYVLRLNIQRDEDNILQYHSRTVIKNFYVDITDFNKYDGQVILFGEESVQKWIIENNIKYILYDEVQIGISSPYFFKNNLVDENVYLAQNTTSIEKGSDVAMMWYKKGYNPGIHSKNIKPISFTLYSYKNPTDVKKIKGKDSNELKILEYTIDSTLFYTVLLKLN